LTQALGLIEIRGWTPAMAALDAMTKAATVALQQVELNDLYGVCIKIAGSVADVQSAIGSAKAIAEQMHVACVTQVINAPAPPARAAYDAPHEFNALIEQDVVHKPAFTSEQRMSEQAPFAIGFIETQGLTAVIEAIDTACKAASVEILGREKLGGGYISVVIKGDVAAVSAAVNAGRAKIENGALGKIIAAHVIPRPSTQVLALISKIPA
jgi:microcompartment protein CcmL/EutN